MNRQNKVPIDFEAYRRVIRQRESSDDYRAQNRLGYVGAYQMGAQALEEAGYLKPGSAKEGNNALLRAENWVLPGGLDEFLATPQEQDAAFDAYTEKQFGYLKNMGVVSENDTPDFIAGALGAAHLKGPGGARELILKGKDNVDANGVGASEYFELGKQSQMMTASNQILNEVPTTEIPIYQNGEKIEYG